MNEVSHKERHEMRKAQNIAFAVIVGGVLLSVLACRVFFAVVPGAQASEYSELEHRAYQGIDEVLQASFVDGEMQGLFDRYLADGVPARNQVLLLNATLQRQCIATAAKAFDFDVYPTFYGSDINVVQSMGMLATTAEKTPNAQSSDLNALVNTLNDAAAKHPDVNFSCRFVLQVRQSEMNPTYGLRSGDLVDSDWVKANIVDRLSPKLNAAVDGIGSEEELRTMWFSTDAHWTLKRALVTYDSIADQLGLNPAPKKGYKKVISKWYGSGARVGLYEGFSSELYDIPTDFSHLRYYTIKDDVLSQDERSDPGKREKTLSKASHQMKQGNDFQGYSSYYGPFNGLIVNEGANNGRTCLLIGDSLTHCLKRYIASNYAKTYSILPGNSTTHMALEDVIEAYSPDDVIYITQSLKYQSIASASPEFIGLPSGFRRQLQEPDW